MHTATHMHYVSESHKAQGILHLLFVKALYYVGGDSVFNPMKFT